MPNPSAPHNGGAAIDGQITIAVAGLGRRIATVIRHLAAAAPGARLVGYVDPAPMGLEMLAKRNIGAGVAYGDVSSMLTATTPDLLMVGSPNHLHLSHIRAGLEAGVRVFTEKPVVRTEEETWEMARLLATHGQDAVLVGLVLRSAPLVRGVQAVLDAGKLGDLISFEGNEHLHPEHGAFLMRDWRRHQAHGGSFLLDKCCHDFDLYRLFAGNARPARVTSFGGRAVFTDKNQELEAQRYPGGEEAYRLWPAGWNATGETFGSDGDVTDHQTALVAYENGVQLAFHANTHSAIPQRRWYLSGTRGALEADLITNRLTFRDALGAQPPETQIFEGKASEHYGSDPAMGRDLAAHLLEGAAFPVHVYDALVAGLTVMAIDKAMTTNKVVDCRPLWEKLDGALRR